MIRPMRLAIHSFTFAFFSFTTLYYFAFFSPATKSIYRLSPFFLSLSLSLFSLAYGHRERWNKGREEKKNSPVSFTRHILFPCSFMVLRIFLFIGSLFCTVLKSSRFFAYTQVDTGRVYIAHLDFVFFLPYFFIIVWRWMGGWAGSWRFLLYFRLVIDASI